MCAVKDSENNVFRISNISAAVGNVNVVFMLLRGLNVYELDDTTTMSHGAMSLFNQFDGANIPALFESARFYDIYSEIIFATSFLGIKKARCSFASRRFPVYNPMKR